MRKETLLEMIAGRLNVLYAHDPDRAEFIVNSIIDAMAVPGVRREGQDMRKTYKIELKIDFEDEKRHKIATHLMRKAARGILTQATLIADGAGVKVPKGYIYAAMAFSLAVEALNIRARAKRKAQKSS